MNDYFYQHEDTEVTKDILDQVNAVMPSVKITEEAVAPTKPDNQEYAKIVKQQNLNREASETHALNLQKAGFADKAKGVYALAETSTFGGVVDYFAFDKAFLRETDHDFFKRL